MFSFYDWWFNFYVKVLLVWVLNKKKQNLLFSSFQQQEIDLTDFCRTCCTYKFFSLHCCIGNYCTIGTKANVFNHLLTQSIWCHNVDYYMYLLILRHQPRCLGTSMLILSQFKTRQDKIFILINHNRTMVQRKTSFKYISHIIHSTHDKMDSH